MFAISPPRMAPLPPLPVAVYNNSKLSPSQLKAIENEIARVYKKVDQITWVTPGPNVPSAPKSLFFNTIPRPSPDADALGASIGLDAPYGWINEQKVQNYAQEGGAITAPYLSALVASHELGHMLGLNHTRGTVMSPYFNRSQFLYLLSRGFNPSQIAEMRATIAKLLAPSPIKAPVNLAAAGVKPTPLPAKATPALQSAPALLKQPATARPQLATTPWQ
jgi:hypothetical protein